MARRQLTLDNTVAAELAGNSFTIQTDEPHVKVAWRLVPLVDDGLVLTTERGAP